MKHAPINLKEKLDKIPGHWAPRIVASLNDMHVKLAKLQGEFVWHSHPETDELFLVLEGSLRIELRDDRILLREGEMYVVPKGVEHKPVAERECRVLLVEPAGTVNTGDTGGPRTAPADEWI